VVSAKGRIGNFFIQKHLEPFSFHPWNCLNE